MKTKIALIGIVILSALLFFGCTESEKTNYQEPSGEEITNEINNTWENEEELNTGEIINPEETNTQIPDETISENEEISIGEIM
jgi:PBP1b-binding outer membrane lipoprotein LpoB